MLKNEHEPGSDADLIHAIQVAVDRRAREVLVMALLALVLLGVAVVGVMLNSGFLRGTALGAVSMIVVVELVMLRSVIHQQRLLDRALSELTSRTQMPSLTHVSLQRLDGTGLLIPLEVTSAVLLALVIGLTIWTTVLMNMKDDPSVSYFRVGAVLLALLFVAIFRILVLMMRGQRLLRGPKP